MEELIAAKQTERDELSKQFEIDMLKSRNDLNNSIADLAEDLRKRNEAIVNAEENARQIAGDLAWLNGKVQLTQNEINRLVRKIAEYTERLMTVKDYYSTAIKRSRGENEGRVMEYNGIDKMLTDTLEALRLQYPQLADAFAAIEWSKIWQPKFQAMTIDIKPSADRCGIYRIWTDENGVVKSYVGQAKKIRERWSQHIKKMLGVDKADNNKFYSNVKPYNAHFEIIEDCKESELNDREHYWIEFYNCVSDGYNTKG